jgi:N-acetylglucosaminyldiphosphoundecaprenol N-acetyl-beta-D-mannosaminyltransferase
VDNITNDQTLARIEAMIAAGQASQIVTVNPEFVMTAQSDFAFRDTINNAALSLPDGIGIWWASRYLGCPVSERVPGVDLVVRLAELSEQKGYRLYFLGAMPGVAEKTIEVLRSRFPTFVVAGSYAGSPRPEDEDGIGRRIRATKPHILFVAYGAPAQDLWISKNLHRLQVPVCVGIGGSFDYISGIQPIAPPLLRKLGLEWMYRLATQPRRWRRMLSLPRFAWRVLWSR